MIFAKASALVHLLQRLSLCDEWLPSLVSAIMSCMRASEFMAGSGEEFPEPTTFVHGVSDSERNLFLAHAHGNAVLAVLGGGLRGVHIGSRAMWTGGGMGGEMCTVVMNTEQHDSYVVLDAECGAKGRRVQAKLVKTADLHPVSKSSPERLVQALLGSEIVDEFLRCLSRLLSLNVPLPNHRSVKDNVKYLGVDADVVGLDVADDGFSLKVNYFFMHMRLSCGFEMCVH